MGKDVKALAGFSVVPKKDPSKQRKLIMSCATNYMAVDVKARAEHGLFGGEALGSLHVPSDFLNTVTCDESNAFTHILTPEWLWPWMAVPPIQDVHIWSLLPESIKVQCSSPTFIYPCYCRLGMGFSHAVHILLNINLTVIGRALLGKGSRVLASLPSSQYKVMDCAAEAVAAAAPGPVFISRAVASS